jgi:hypothetical protein
VGGNRGELALHGDLITRLIELALERQAEKDNEYGPIRSYKIVLIGHYGNGVLIAILINGRKSDALNLAYDPKTRQLSFAPPGVSLYLGP